MSDPIVAVALRLVPMAAAKVNQLARADAVRNLRRLVAADLKRSHQVPGDYRERVAKEWTGQAVDPELSGHLTAWLATGDDELVDGAGKRWSELLAGATDLEPAQITTVVAVTKASIKSHLADAQATDRQAVHTESERTRSELGKAVREESERTRSELGDRIDRAVREATGQKDAVDTALDEVRRLLQARLEPEADVAPDLASAGDPRPPDAVGAEASIPALPLGDRADTWRTPEEIIAALRMEDADGAERLAKALAKAGPSEVVAMVRQREGHQEGDTLGFLVATARIVARIGAFSEAEQAYVWASQLPGLPAGSRARQLVRASAMAQVQGDEERYQQRLAEAKQADPDHPSIALAEARATRDPEEVFRLLERVEPQTPGDEALLAVTRAQAHLSQGDRDVATQELQRATELDPRNLAVREMQAVFPLHAAQTAAGNEQPIDRASLHQAAARFEELRPELEEQGRWDESAGLAARAVEALALADDPEGAVARLKSVKRMDDLSEDARTTLGRMALLSGETELALRFISPEDRTPEARLVRAEVEAMGPDHDVRDAALATLQELVDSGEDEVEARAAYALLSTAANDPAVEWDDRAEAKVRDVKPLTAAVFRAERCRVQGDLTKAQQVLLPFASNPQALRQLRDYAVQQENWEQAKDRARTLRARVPDDRDRFAYADILRRSGDTEGAEAEFLILARDPTVDDHYREGAFNYVVEIIGGERNYSAIRSLAREWREALLNSESAIWNLAFSLARTSEHQEALKLLTESSTEPSTQQQAQLAAEIFHRAAPTHEALTRIEEWSTRFDQPEPLEGVLAVTFLRTDPREVELLDDEVRREIIDRTQSFTDRFPDSPVMRAIKAPTTAEGLTALMREMHGDLPRLQQEMWQEVVEGQAPLNAVTVVSPGRQVGETWGEMSSRPLGFAMPGLDELDRDAAREALGGGAVWDPSSICIAGGLGHPLAELIRSALPGSLIAQDTLEDLDLTAAEPVSTTPPSGITGYDPAADEAFFHETSPDDHARAQYRTAGMLALARELEVRSARGDGEDEASVLHNDDDSDPALKTFAGTILVARAADRTVFSDDRWIRQFARQEGLKAFGTIALIDVLAEQDVISAEQRQDARERLAASGGWGVALSADEMIDSAEGNSWHLNDVLAGALRDKAVFRDRPVERLKELGAFLQAVFDRAPHTFRRWLLRILHAIQGNFLQPNRPLAARTFLAMLWQPGLPEPVLTAACLQRLVDEMQSLPGYLSPAGSDVPFEALVLQLQGAANREERSLLFAMTLRRLGAREQLRLWLAGTGGR